MVVNRVLSSDRCTPIPQGHDCYDMYMHSYAGYNLAGPSSGVPGRALSRYLDYRRSQSKDLEGS